jgi:DivIVA domain-containing protein
MSALPPGVRAGGAFPKAEGKGYNAAQVDAFMANARGLSASAIREVQFETAKKHAYQMDAVDAALDRLEVEARARELEA